MGGLRKVSVSEKRRKANEANARAGRLRMNQSEYDELKAAKTRLARALTSRGVAWLEQIITEGPPHWERAGGESVLVEGNPLFEWAMNFAADRAGMPRQAVVEGSAIGGFTIVVNDERGGLGWPGMAVGGGDARDDRGRPLVGN